MRGRSVGQEDGNRGQTTQDFAVGMSLFLIAVTVVFGLVPTVLVPYDSGATGSQAAQADRVATTVLEQTTVAGTSQTLDSTELEDTPRDEAGLQAAAGLGPTTNVNVTLRHIEDDRIVHSAGAPVPTNRDTTTRTRIVRTTDNSCEPACRLVVEVW